MRTLEGSNRIRNGLAGIVIVLLVIGVGQSFASVPMLFATPTYYGEFKDSAGINPGDKVRIAGMDVGLVRSLKIDGDKVEVGFGLGGHQIGTDSHLGIRTETILGKRVLEIEPRGSKILRPDGVLVVSIDDHENANLTLLVEQVRTNAQAIGQIAEGQGMIAAELAARARQDSVHETEITAQRAALQQTAADLRAVRLKAAGIKAAIGAGAVTAWEIARHLLPSLAP